MSPLAMLKRQGWRTWEGMSRIPGRVLATVLPRRTVSSRGLRFTLQYDNWITQRRWQYCNIKEPETLDWIDRSLRSGEVLFDVGANIGIFAIYAALRHPGARVVAFEPEYANLHLLRDNVVYNHLHDQIDIYSIALGNRTGVSRLHLQDFTPGAALHTESPQVLELTRTNKPVIGWEGICTVTLDGFCEETGMTPNCLKLDVDGTEPEILEGASRTLRSPALRSIIVEMGDDQHIRAACTRLLEAAGLHRIPVPSRFGNEIWARE
ncbi:MAG: hypothetical protein COV75_02180 [Candidatus Omnitrophica bacterium CG11_big_fil_rev_8_21_14_0_20_63_9]|nr:MAG: hypothetical protein COV75_02180 [Candidatus Omnitrophica bacterium CG11_big_fil_rev_8_21_14_0_20_63_9]